MLLSPGEKVCFRDSCLLCPWLKTSICHQEVLKYDYVCTFSANALIYDASQNKNKGAGQLPKLFSIFKKII